MPKFPTLVEAAWPKEIVLKSAWFLPKLLFHLCEKPKLATFKMSLTAAQWQEIGGGML